MQAQTDIEIELFVLRTQIEIDLLHLGLDSRLRRQIVKTIDRVRNLNKLTLFASALNSVRERPRAETYDMESNLTVFAPEGD